jgi:4-diphosphocytidyl-2-C-methyl-D-erythritol kinase
MAAARLSRFCPAKLNLFLAVTGRQTDGMHHLLSVACPLDWGDTLHLDWSPTPGADSITCNRPDIPCSADNLVIKATALARAAWGLIGHARWHLDKQVPPGSGLGGGSSNAVAALRLLRDANPGRAPADDAALLPLAAQLGADCPLFLMNGACLMSGTGTLCERLPPAVSARLAGSQLWVFRPPFPIATGPAYARLARSGQYTPQPTARQLLAPWLAGDGDPLPPALNSFQPVASAWFPSLAVVLDTINRWPESDARLSGSGSACFARIPASQEQALGLLLRQAWGDNFILRKSALAPSA